MDSSRVYSKAGQGFSQLGCSADGECPKVEELANRSGHDHRISCAAQPSCRSEGRSE